ncbi:Uncharacterized protein TPAR_06311 [Tolypocladium paradoxum]|uniref:Selenoprotein W-like protein n=1 Tax=Tolypocladium paradoxum TaxID=94208 RepID=A0A2S4KTI0_9HYPO|nr:Uncharacterized protein TPAR_06311 [Tolypocladium paradoxum]
MSSHAAQSNAPFPLPRVTIEFCTQCKWMLRAAYFAQELLSTFSRSLGEVALQPSTAGAFIVTIHHQPGAHRREDGGQQQQAGTAAAAVSTVLWDRQANGGFPEPKELKRRVRDVIEPGRDLGHVDRDYAKETKEEERAAPVRAKESAQGVAAKGGEGNRCEDCRSATLGI